MASALTIKSGGTWAVKSGATMSIKDAGLPPYVIEGLEQSHWMMANAAVDGSGSVISIADAYGSNISVVRQNANYAWNYSADGWSLNGKTLPVMTAFGGNPFYAANGWASKLKGYTGAFTVINLMDFGTFNNTAERTFRVFLNSYSGGNNMEGYTRQTSGQWDIYRDSGGTIRVRNDSGALGKQIVVQEYAGTGVPTAMSQFRLWINGTAQTLSLDSGSGGRTALADVDRFYVWPSTTGGSKWAQFHIYKGSLTDDQRNQVTNYLKSISGIA